MPIDFPESPTVGQEYTYGGKTYIRNAGGYWTAFPAAGGEPAPPTKILRMTELAWNYQVIARIPFGVLDIPRLKELEYV